MSRQLRTWRRSAADEPRRQEHRANCRESRHVGTVVRRTSRRCGTARSSALLVGDQPAARRAASTAARPESTVSCSQTRTTVQPCAVSLELVSRSRAAVVASFCRHQSALARGFDPCSRQSCQKQPSTNTATRQRVNTMSAFRRKVGSGRASTRNLRPRRCKARRKPSSAGVSRVGVLRMRRAASSLEETGVRMAPTYIRPRTYRSDRARMTKVQTTSGAGATGHCRSVAGPDFGGKVARLRFLGSCSAITSPRRAWARLGDRESSDTSDVSIFSEGWPGLAPRDARRLRAAARARGGGTLLPTCL